MDGRWLGLIMVCVLFAAGPTVHIASQPTPGDRADISTVVSPSRESPIVFEENLGQTNGAVRYLARLPGHILFLTQEEAVFQPTAPDQELAPPLRIQFVGSAAILHAAEQLPGASNYLHGSDPNAWVTGARHHARVVYEDIWPGIDAVFRSNINGQLEYDFLLDPGADPDAIRLRLNGASASNVDERGDLVIDGEGTLLRHKAPVAFQQTSMDTIPVRTEFRVDDGVVSFEVGSYDPTLPLVIDPVVVLYSSYLGGSHVDSAQDVAVDTADNAYITGTTVSIDFPTTSGSYQPTRGGFPGLANNDVFVTKLDTTGTLALYSTYVGGAGNERATSIVLDPDRNVVVAGWTDAVDFPTVNPFQATHGGGTMDAFVFKLNAVGSALTFSTYLGGNRWDQALGVDLDAFGRPVVVGYTDSGNFPTANPFQGVPSGTSGFVTRLVATGNALVHSSFLGNFHTRVHDVAVDGSGTAYVAGWTSFTGFPASAGAYQTTKAGGSDAFVAAITSSGSLGPATFLGGVDFEVINSIAVDSTGIYVTGNTESTNFPIASPGGGPFQPNLAGAWDAFVTKLSPGLGSLVYSTYLGGSKTEFAETITVDEGGNTYLAGTTYSTDYPLQEPSQSSLGGTLGYNDAFVANLSPTGHALGFSTYHGGEFSEIAYGIAVDASRNVHIVGATSSSDFPITPNAHQPFYGTNDDAFVARFESINPPPPPPPPPTPYPFSATILQEAAGAVPSVTVSDAGLCAISAASEHATVTCSPSPGNWSCAIPWVHAVAISGTVEGSTSCNGSPTASAVAIAPNAATDRQVGSWDFPWACTGDFTGATGKVHCYTPDP